MSLTLIHEAYVASGRRLLNVPVFDYVKVSFHNAQVSTVYSGYYELKPVYIQPLVNVDNIPVAYGEIMRFTKNPQINKMPTLPLPYMGIDVSGKIPLWIYFYSEQ